MDRWLEKALLLVEEIQWTAAQIALVKNTLVRDLGLDRQRWAALLAISRSHYCLSISDLARALKQSRQSTHRMAVELARKGLIQLLTNRDDRRILQLELTAAGKSAIGQIRQRFRTSVLEFSAHLDSRALQSTTEVLRNLRMQIAAFQEPRQVPLRHAINR